MLDVGLAEALTLIAILAVTGAIGGIISGLLGVGGGIVIVPVLFFVFLALDIDEEVRMHVAVGTSLATIIFTGFMSARSHWKKGSVDTDLLKRWGPAIAFGVVIGTILGGNVSGEVLTLVFAVVAGIVAINMALKPSEKSAKRSMPKTPLKEALGTVIGLFSVMMGIGGGTLSVPILSFFAYPIRKAVGTAAAIGLIIAIPGTLGYIWFGLGVEDLPPFSLGYVNLAGVLAIIPASMLTAPLGAKIAHAISPAALRYCFAAFLAITSIRMLMSVF
ncbi:sulfite exporter TauE/SafE family protein [Pararhizobium haloflavum]|uniref:sulfite exporter TauE/SafE family protein n=1 Tax=Pararhizobium haloflavum TaxID=2037914 RepID=UPI000C18D7F0|nr:sulfite exporter TauE/SafE family protein [Pararhizobium haloflavum]